MLTERNDGSLGRSAHAADLAYPRYPRCGGSVRDRREGWPCRGQVRRDRSARLRVLAAPRGCQPATHVRERALQSARALLPFRANGERPAYCGFAGNRARGLEAGASVDRLDATSVHDMRRAGRRGARRFEDRCRTARPPPNRSAWTAMKQLQRLRPCRGPARQAQPPLGGDRDVAEVRVDIERDGSHPSLLANGQRTWETGRQTTSTDPRSQRNRPSRRGGH
jgi:hypothetical protein